MAPSAEPLADDPSLTRVSDPEARRLLAAGDVRGASDVYTERAARAGGVGQREDYQLLAAEILFDRGMLEPALERLGAVPETPSTPLLAQRRDILVAKGLLFSGDPEAALLALPDPADVRMPIHRARVHETRAQVYRQLDDPDGELLARVALEREVRDPAIIERSHDQIWRFLSRQPLSTLRDLTTNVRGEVYQGWVALALAESDAGTSPAEREAAFARWASLFPMHPANGEVLAALRDPDAGGGTERNFDGGAIEHVAVLLPMSAGAAGAPAAAIRDGLIAAWTAERARGGQVPVLRLHDVGENTAYARTAYEKALAEGADLVIGPLRKEAVAAIVTQRRVAVPTLTLNTVDTVGVGEADGGDPNVVQFGLAPEEEARAAASRAAALSLRNAVVLQSDDSRGDREARAFRDELYAHGGDVAHVAVLPLDTYDYSAQIREALGVDESDERFRRLSATIGERLFFEPAIRNDVDVVFLALTSEEARSARPQLDFFRARDIPRLATSRIASLVDDEKINRDLDTIYYTDAPWVLDASLADDPLRRDILANFPAADGAYAKLYALGADAWLLARNLGALADGERLAGYTGELALGEDGRIRRRLDWAQYRDGRSEPVERLEAEPLGEIRSGAARN